MYKKLSQFLGLSGAAQVQAASQFALSGLPDELSAKPIQGAREAGRDSININTRGRQNRSCFCSFIFCENYCVH
jgi:hypothetical protein